MFKLHSRLDADTLEIGNLPLSAVLLMNNKHLPWVILVPRKPGIREIYELAQKDQIQLLHESSLTGKALMSEFKGDKLNIGSLGNIVPQLHVHHIIRYEHDSIWPNPVWGNIATKTYAKIEGQQMIKRLQKRLSDCCSDFNAVRN